MPVTIHAHRRMSPYRNFLIRIFFNVTEAMLRPFFFIINGALGPLLPTTPERRNMTVLWIKRIVFMPLFFGALILILIPTLLVFALKNFLHLFRDAYCLAINDDKISIMSGKSWKTSSKKGEPIRYTVATANLCLLPEVLARYNNLNNTKQRTMEISQRIVTDQMHFRRMTQSFSQLPKQSSNHSSSEKESATNNFKVSIISHFTHIDFFCLQETFDRDCSKKLLTELHKVFPWIVFDADHSHLNKNFCGMNSGLMVASRYEIMAVKFKPFSARCGFCTITNKGLLMTKVNLDTCTGDGKPKVGYLFNTHLQAFQGDKPIVQCQLSEILTWTEEFRQETDEGSDEYVAFDILCGDFNVDNMSPGEAAISRHKLFEEYVDVGRVRPGLDQDWTVGTECRNAYLYDPEVKDPEGLKACLQDPYLRQQYIIDADIQTATLKSIYNPTMKKDEHGNTILSPVGGRRRIDLILYRKNCLIDVSNYNFVTRLARLTDHIPVSMTMTSQN